jgi:hypothetical protein
MLSEFYIDYFIHVKEFIYILMSLNLNWLYKY